MRSVSTVRDLTSITNTYPNFTNIFDVVSIKISSDNATNKVAQEMFRRARQLNLNVNVALAANPDVAIHAARSFKGIIIIDLGNELLHLGSLSIKRLDSSLAGIESEKAKEIHETFALWGIRTFGDLAKLPLSGVAERLGQEGVGLAEVPGEGDIEAIYARIVSAARRA